MNVRSIKRIAADLLGVGVNRIRIKAEGEEQIDRIKKAVSREDVRSLIADKLIEVAPKKITKPASQKKRKRRSIGSRKGKKYSRKSKKEIWMEKIRALRKFLRELIEKGKVDKKHKKELYLKIKGGHFRGKKAFYVFLKDNHYLKEENVKEVEQNA